VTFLPLAAAPLAMALASGLAAPALPASVALDDAFEDVGELVQAASAAATVAAVVDRKKRRNMGFLLTRAAAAAL